MAGKWKTASTGLDDGPLWRGDHIKNTPTTNRTLPPPLSSQQRMPSVPPSLPRTQLLPKDISLFQFLDADGKPAIILRLADHSTRQCHQRHVYENNAFHKAYRDGKSKNAFIAHAVRQISQDTSSRTSFTVNLLGRPCTATVISDQWISLSWNAIYDTKDELGAGSVLYPPKKHDNAAFPDATSSDEQRQRHAEAIGWCRFEGAQLTAHQHLILGYPWHETPLGPIDSWSDTLKISIASSILNPEPRALYWGKDFIAIYNEHCVPIFGGKHPKAMGKSAKETWPETWPIGGPFMIKALQEGKPSKLLGVQCFFRRSEILEEVFFDSTFLPIPGHDDDSSGVLNQFSETTDDVLAGRHQKIITTIHDMAWSLDDEDKFWSAVSDAFEESHSDIAYAILFTASNPQACNTAQTATSTRSTTRYTLSHSVGVAGSSLPNHLYDSSADSLTEDPVISLLRRAHLVDDIVMLTAEDGSLPTCLRIAVTDRGYGDEIWCACVMAIFSLEGGEPSAFVLIGMNPRRPLDHRSRSFMTVLRESLMRGVATVRIPGNTRQQQKKLEDLHQSLLQRLHHSDREVDRLRNRFERMAGTAPVGMFMYTADGRTPIYVNDEYLSIFGISREEHLKHGWQDTIHEQDKDRVLSLYTELVSSQKPTVVEFRVKNEFQILDEVTGQPIMAPRYVICSCTPEFDEDGNVLNLQGWVLDISQQRLTQRLLNSRLDEVMASKQNAENFIDMVSHEMRNPLSAILQSADGIVSLIETAEPYHEHVLDRTTQETIVDASQTIILCAQHQKRIVDDILTLSKLDANLLVISPDKSDPATLLRKAVKMFEGQLDQASIATSVEILPSVAALNVDFVMMDTSRVLQVIINLLTNAIKFTQHPKKRRQIDLVLDASTSMSRPDENDDSPVKYVPRRESRPRYQMGWEWGAGQDIYLTFMVRDTGKGLTEEEMKMLFQRFSQASPKTYKKYGGSGLGLFISRELTELQGGQIGVSSVAGEGSTFAFYVLTRRWLPVTPLDDGRRLSVHTPSMLESPMAYSRRGSIALLDTSARARMNSRSGQTADMPVLQIPAVPTNTNADNAAAGSAAAAAAIQVAPSSSAWTPPPLLRPMNILIVEDNEVNARVMSKQLLVAGHAVHVANHGLEALDYLRTTTLWTSADRAETNKEDPAEQQEPDYFNRGQATAVATPDRHGARADHDEDEAESDATPTAAAVPLDVILMDLEMPVLDGLGCVRRIRAMQAGGRLRAHVPVIAVTANARSEQIALALAAGMDEVVTKPFRIPQVLERAARLVARYGGAAGGAAAGTGGAGVGVVEEKEAQSGDGEVAREPGSAARADGGGTKADDGAAVASARDDEDDINDGIGKVKNGGKLHGVVMSVAI